MGTPVRIGKLFSGWRTANNEMVFELPMLHEGRPLGRILCPTVLSSTPVIRGIGSCQEGERATRHAPRAASGCLHEQTTRRILVRARHAATCDYARGRRVGLRRPAVRSYERPRGACSSPCDAVVDRESVAADLFQSQAKAGPATATISAAIAIKRLIFASSDFP